MEERFIFLVSKFLTGKESLFEKEELQRLLKENDDLNQIYKLLFLRKSVSGDADLWDAEQAYAAHFVKMQLNNQFEDDADENLAKTFAIEEVPARQSKSVFFWRTAIAASIIAIVACAYFLDWAMIIKTDDISMSKNEIATRKGSKSKIILPDGSLVWLNAESKISYSTDFRGNSREVQLTGEAFFDVKKDKRRPFIIHTNTFDVRVLGTAFNIRSYPGEETTETSLIRGSLEILLHNHPGGNPIILKPNEKLTVSSGGEKNVYDSVYNKILFPQSGKVGQIKLSNIHFIKADSTIIESLWVENKLAFDDDSFERVVSIIERWYNVEFSIMDERLKSKHFSAIFVNKSLKEVMEALSLALKINYRISDNKVIVW